ncbi:MAG TPA: decaprenyl-phosphate phosphoribosyltransferase [Streptosporangiaceae bacterium]
MRTGAALETPAPGRAGIPVPVPGPLPSVVPGPALSPGPGPASGPARRPRSAGGWPGAVLRASRPRQWPKNLLVLAAPVAGATVGRPYGLAYALVALVAFIAASSTVYLVNDVVDAERDRQHPVKRHRPIASGELPAAHALAVAVVLTIAAISSGFWISAPGLTVTIAIYLVISFSYSLALKHVPVVELACVASGFVLRALGGAAATHVPPSGWFLTVCSLGALMVAVSKRRGELATLGDGAAGHRPVVRFYRYRSLGVVSRLLSGAMVVSYALWAVTSSGGDREIWHLVSLVALAVALARFDWLSGHADGKGVEDLIIRDRVMAVAELAWLALFAAGLLAARR